MKKILILTIVTLLFSTKAFSQPTYQWHTFYGSAVGGALGTDRGYGAALDSSGNIYTTGMSESTWNGPGNQAPIHAHSGITNVFVLKMDSSGNYQWHTFFGGTTPNDCYGFDMASDSAGNLYITGYSEAAWNGPSAQAPIHAFSGGGARDFFVLKIDSNGAYQWHTFYGNNVFNEGSGIICDSSNNVYVSGASSGTWNGPAAAAPLNAHAGNRDIFVLKLNSAGAYQWHTFYGSAGDNDESFVIDADSTGNVVIGGYSNSSWNGPGPSAPRHAHSGGKEITVLKLNSAGAYQWHTFYGSAASDEIRGIRTDAAGNVYACGNSQGTWQGDGASGPIHAYSGAADHMILKLNNSGVYQWHTFYGSAGANDYPNDLVLDTNNDIYIQGRSYATWQGDGATAPLKAFSGYRDISIMKLNSNGVYQWHTFYGDAGDDRGADIVLASPSLYVVGRCSATWNGDNPGDTPLNAYAGGPGDAFVLKTEYPFCQSSGNYPDLIRMGHNNLLDPSLHYCHLDVEQA